MPVEGDYECFSDDWRRTHPDLVLNLPSDAPAYREAQDHVLVDFTPGGDLLAIWTMACKASGDDMGVFYARSGDGGARWSAPAYLHEPGPRAGTAELLRLSRDQPKRAHLLFLQLVVRSWRGSPQRGAALPILG